MHAITLKGIKTYNLKNFDLTLPHHKLYVVTGVSGSGKSSLAFDTLYAEGQRRYVESLSAYARQFLERMEKPDVDFVSGIPPALAIEAKNVISNARSTVGTQTEINDYLRLLFSRVGHTYCPDCGTEALKSQPDSIASFLIEKFSGEEIIVLAEVDLGGSGREHAEASLPELERQGFSEAFEKGKTISFEALIKTKRTTSRIHVICDRLQAQPKNRKRLVDSLELAGRLGKGKIKAVCAKKELTFSDELSCPACAKTFRDPVPNLFSFNSPLGACPACQGFGRVITLDWDLVVPDENKTLAGGAIEPWTKPSSEWEFKHLLEYCRKKKIPTDKPWKELSAAHRKLILQGQEGDKFFSVRQFFEYLEKKTYKMHVRVFLSRYRTFVPCRDCAESRLKPQGLAVKVAGKNIFEFQELPLSELLAFLAALQFTETERSRVEPVYLEIQKRVRFLVEVGLGYLSLARLSRTLSGGEMQRIHLASSLGSALVDTLYVLDEPSIGLHERDNELLIRLMKELRDLGNTLIVVEHDRAMIETADEVIDIGPGGGERGGELLYQGAVAGLKACRRSLTGRYLSGELVPSIAKNPVSEKKVKLEQIEIQGAAEHNLKQVNVTIPLRKFVLITGVSGSGKSTLVYDVLYKNFLRARGQSVQEPGKVQRIKGFEKIDQLVLVDQSPIGRSPRSNPATYIGAYDDIRKCFASSREAKNRGLEPAAFSFNVDGGRCDTCKGAGQVKVEMHFLADVFMPCEACQGRRFQKHVLDVHFQGKNIDQVLALTVEEAVTFFRGVRALEEKLVLLVRVGLGYLRLGQSATTLSGGEAQRLKLAEEMANAKDGHVLYVFDEPTTGLHYHDIHYLLQAFQELLARGHSLVVIEHNMEVIHTADWVIDLGPEGGSRGGHLVYAGPCDGILNVKASFTGQYLRKHRDWLKQNLMKTALV
ncbi:MAG: excinuclease ABC subunit UvrA [Candidatus Omnitrophica bacterium]|nr:excinuclease ABC subunit UvrA [Candidatus Omnitrophota bacterium]